MLRKGIVHKCPERRELLDGAKQWMEVVELALEHLPQIFGGESRRRRHPPLHGQDIRMPPAFRI
jgi:hypothetical protein